VPLNPDFTCEPVKRHSVLCIRGMQKFRLPFRQDSNNQNTIFDGFLEAAGEEKFGVLNTRYEFQE
jgi:hypothetical protein